ncbi:MAG: serine/threonine protein kinase/tetratricopeptide (TPR) repeat protein [Planctomycetota bacterium]|jgi:serine/threonine protein kinase/tetratricopeptide (TPR) repeat protein
MAEMTNPTAPKVPDDLPCQLVGELGRGATGPVWRAVLTESHGELPVGLEIALKRMHPEIAKHAGQVHAFEQECELVLGLKHPGLLTGWASGADGNGPWLAMQLLTGPSLRQQLNRLGALPEPQVRTSLERLSGALFSLHQAGYLHGDLKPDNVRLDDAGRAVLIDFGFAQKLADGPQAARVTGSLAYLSPRELRGQVATPSSEVYTLGILLYELSTGTHPFATRDQIASGEGLAGVLKKANFEMPSLRVPTLSPFIDGLLEAMLQKNPIGRPTLAELQVIASQQEESEWWREQLDARNPKRSVPSASALPMVGRDEELRKVLGCARRAFAAQARGSVLELSGSSGSGKTRLMREFAVRIRRSATPPLYLHGRCARFEEQGPCGPIIQLLSSYLRLSHGSTPTDRERAILNKLLPSAERDTLLEVLDPGFDGTTATSVAAALCTWIVRLAEERPLAIYLDDLDFADEGTLEVLAHLTRQLSNISLLLVVGRDAEESPRRPEALHLFEELLRQVDSFERMALMPLDLVAVRKLTDELFLRSTPRLRLAKVLWERSRGNPGLIAELLRGLVDRGDAIQTEAGLKLKVHPDKLPLPASLRDEILRAYARLKPLDRMWLGRLAVCGGRIQTRFLLGTWPNESAPVLDETLARLMHTGWLRSEGDRYRFRRPALRAAIYKRLSNGRRKEMHLAIAKALRPGPGGRLSLTDAFQRAYHLRAAADYGELMKILRPLLQRLHDRGQPARVYTLGLWGLEALAELPETPDPAARALEFLWSAADAADRLGYREKQRALLDQLIDLDIDLEQNPDDAGRVYLLHARYSISVGHYGPGRGMLGNALQFFRLSRNSALTSDTLRRLADVHIHTGDMQEGRRMMRQARETAPTDYYRARAEIGLGELDMLEGKVESSLKRSDQGLMLLRKTDVFEALAVRALAHSLRARVYRAAGRPRRALVSAQNATRFAQRAGDRRLEIETQARLGCHLLDIDRVEEAETLLRDALLVASEIEDRHGESLAALFLGILLAEQGDETAPTFLARCARVAHKMGLARTEAVCISIEARITFHRDPEAALKQSVAAVELLDRAGAELIDRIVIRGTHAMVLKTLGRSSEAATQVQRLRRLMRTANGRIESPLMQRRQRLATRQLLKAALSPEGPVYRRVHLEKF